MICVFIGKLTLKVINIHHMKKLLLTLLVVVTSLATYAAGADWYFVYDGNGWKTDESTQFQTTSNADVVILSNYQLTPAEGKGGVQFQITNKDWSKYYGWSAEADGNDVVNSEFKLGNSGAAWVTCEAGKYDITFNSKNATIKFTKATAALEDVAVSSDDTLEYYTITGTKVVDDNMRPGLYIRKQGNKISKVIIK